MALLFDTIQMPFKSAQRFVKNPSMQTFGDTLLSGTIKPGANLAQEASKITPFKADDRLSADAMRFLNDKQTQQAVGVGGALAGAALAPGLLAGTAAPAAPAGSYGAGAYGTAAGYGGATAPAAYGSITPAATSGGLLSGAGSIAKAGMTGLQAAALAKSLMPAGPTAPQITPPSGAGAQELAALNQANQQTVSGISDSSAERRRMNQEIIARMMGGRNYG